MTGEFKLSAVVITYYPNKEELHSKIRRYIDSIDSLIIWENTPADERRVFKVSLPEYEEKIVYLGTGKNEGIAYALNRSIEWSIENGFTHILTMNQDSIWDNFDFFRQKIRKFINVDNIGIFGYPC
jgi:rhamnosyltransferase